MDLDLYQQLVTYLDTLMFPLHLQPHEQLRLRRVSTFYFLRDSILYKRNQNDPSSPLRVVTIHDVETVLHYFHESDLARHFGPLRTYQKIAVRYFWPDMRKQVYDFVRTCHTCQF